MDGVLIFFRCQAKVLSNNKVCCAFRLLKTCCSRPLLNLHGSARLKVPTMQPRYDDPTHQHRASRQGTSAGFLAIKLSTMPLELSFSTSCPAWADAGICGNREKSRLSSNLGCRVCFRKEACRFPRFTIRMTISGVISGQPASSDFLVIQVQVRAEVDTGCFPGSGDRSTRALG
jgi:hypothetical protein